jgi:hypothetical protein
MSCAQEALAKLDGRIEQARRIGALAAFNSEYRSRRLAARAAGQHFMSYAEARRRLQRVLTGVAAGPSCEGRGRSRLRTAELWRWTT